MRTLEQKTLDSLLEYIIEYQKENGKSPTYRQMMKKMNFSSMATLVRYVNRLYSEEKIKKDNLGGIQIAPKFNPSKTVIAPLIGTVACGTPIFAEENIEGTYSLPADIFGSSDIYLLRAKGESMIEAGIKSNDILVVRKCNTAENGDIVIALIDNEATAKRFFKTKNKIILHPENSSPEYLDFILDDVVILGKVISCIHNF